MVIVAQWLDPPVGGLWSWSMFYIYVIQSESSGKIYIGYTGNLVQRLEAHNQRLKTKINSYTKLNRGPWKLVYQETSDTKQEAMKRESELKSYKGREFIKNFINK